MNPKRIRGKNFTEFEKNLLFELVADKFKHILENKETDAVTAAKKNLAWQEVARECNSQNQTGHRTAKQLHALYDNLKKAARTNLFEDKKNAYKTGGGTFVPQSTHLDTKIVSVLGPQFKPLVNKFDSSANFIDVQPSCSSTSIQENDYIEDVTGESIDVFNTEECIENATINDSIIQNYTKTSTEFDNRTPSSVVECSTPQHVRPGQKQKVLSNSLSKKRKSSIESLANRFCERKNFKDSVDDEIKRKKIEILQTEQKIKAKQLEIVEAQLQNDKKLFELNYQNRQKEIAFERKIRQIKLNQLLSQNK